MYPFLAISSTRDVLPGLQDFLYLPRAVKPLDYSRAIGLLESSAARNPEWSFCETDSESFLNEHLNRAKAR